MKISVIIPAYNEELVLGRLLDALDEPAHRRQLDVVVVCNGCTDGTAQVAERHPLAPRVVSLAEGSKHAALVAGDELAMGFPRLYVDADVVIAASDIVRLGQILTRGDVLAVAPDRDLRIDESSWAVRAYYRVWQGLPAVRDGLFGRGVIGVSEAGFGRVHPRPAVLGDDLFLHSRFAADERKVVQTATSIVYGPRTLGDLVRRRVRAAQGNAALQQSQHVRSSTPSSLGQVTRAALRQPRELPSTAVFVSVSVLTRLLATSRKGSPSWLRDESSRSVSSRP